MSSTKIVIIVLVLIAAIFIAFVATGALRSEDAPASDAKTAKTIDPPDWTKSIGDVFASWQPRGLPPKVYSGPTTESIPPDDNQPFRIVTFHQMSGSAPSEIFYKDETPLKPENPLSEMDNPQRCRLPNNDARDSTRCSILALKRGGKLTFVCALNAPCRIEVE